MPEGPPSHVDCEQLAGAAAVLERVYPLQEMHGLRDLLADTQGSARARFAFAKSASGRAIANVSVEAMLRMICQRCLQGFAYTARGGSEVEFAEGGADAADSLREAYPMVDGRVSLLELAEQELLLALPIVAMHPPQSCARAQVLEVPVGGGDAAGERSRPFAGLHDLLKRSDRT